jgi:splicing factor U2AF subunit
MSGELSLGNQSQAAQPPVSPTSRVVELQNMLTEDDLKDEQEYNEILEDTREECSQFGALQSVIIPRMGEIGATKIFLEYVTAEDAGKAIQALAGRTFDGRKVTATLFDETRFANKDYA